MLEITVHDIKGNCPVHNVGDRIIIQNPEINLEETDALCTHALPTILHYVLILEHKWIPFQLGLTKEDDPDNAYIQCLDPGQPYTEGGTVIFRIRKIAHHL
ncbi:MAG: TIGR04076 family protein [Deltaproteobacteria bacterium]|nr:TIGR04076 family protein [Deltaproteobacteria bacterium]MBW2088753.1 TIGR04076 family protein [Deltaproteobacteria bacterium]